MSTISVSTTRESSTSPSSSASPSGVSSSRTVSAVNPATGSSVALAEYNTAHKWDACVENSLVKTGTGLIAAGLVSLLLFRAPVARALLTGLGGGFGAGQSWVECKQLFASSASAKPQLATFQLPILPTNNSNTTTQTTTQPSSTNSPSSASTTSPSS